MTAHTGIGKRGPAMRPYHLFVCCLFSALLLGPAGPLHAQAERWEELLKRHPDDPALLMSLGKYYHDIGGMEKNEGAVKKAEKYLSRLLELQPDDPVAMVYYGSVLTMKARDAFFPWNKINHLKKGIVQMDKAVLFSPDNAEVRLIRGINSASMPQKMGRLAVALEDFNHIEELHRRHPLDMPKKFWLPFYCNFGLALLRDGKSEAAMEKFSKTIEIDPESDYAANARRELKQLEEDRHVR
jgi:tetratricopeptide (TPR) repeat protein